MHEPSTAEDDRPRQGQFGVSPTHGEQRRNRLQRSLRMCLLSSAVRVQPVSAIWNGAPCVLARCTPQMAGARCWSRSSADTETGSCGATFVHDAAFRLNAEVYEFLEAEGFHVRDPPSRQPGAATGLSRHLLRRPVGMTSERSEALPWPASATRHRAGASPVGWSPRSRGILASCFPVSGSIAHQPLPACRAGDRLLQSARHGGAVHQGRQERDSTGPGFPALASATTRGVFSCTPWHTTWANFLRTLALPDGVGHWSLTTLRERAGSRLERQVVRHRRYITFQMAEVAVSRGLFRKILRLIDGLRPAPLPP